MTQTAGFHKINPISLLQFQHHLSYLSPGGRAAMSGKLWISAVMEGLVSQKLFKCFFRSFSTRGNFWGKIFSLVLIYVFPRKRSKLKIMNICTKYSSNSLFPLTQMCLQAVHVEACVFQCACMHLLMKAPDLPWTTDLK